MVDRKIPGKFVFWSSRGPASGQAVIEYLLVVTVTVIIIAALAEKMFKPMDQFVQSIMGDYIACLLETGELPILSAPDDGTMNSECQIYAFQKQDGPGFQRDVYDPGKAGNE